MCTFSKHSITKERIRHKVAGINSKLPPLLMYTQRETKTQLLYKNISIEEI